ncbi:hypothetical protein [Pseudomonas sp. R151218B TE3479]
MRYGLAARYLREIDEIRDLHGLPEDAPRHPNFASGVRWPLLNACEPAEGATDASPTT